MTGLPFISRCRRDFPLVSLELLSNSDGDPRRDFPLVSLELLSNSDGDPHRCDCYVPPVLRWNYNTAQRGLSSVASCAPKPWRRCMAKEEGGRKKERGALTIDQPVTIHTPTS